MRLVTVHCKHRNFEDVLLLRYKPPPDFEELEKDPLVGISMTDSTELWLIQWPVNQLKPDELKGKQLSLKLQDNGKLASFESSGKSYDMVSFACQQPDATVLMASRSESKVVGKISRRVCLVHYPEPSELEKPGHPNTSSQKSSGSSLRGRSGGSSVVQMLKSSEKRNTRESSEMKNEFSHGATTPTHSSKRKSSLTSASSVEEQKSSKQNSEGSSQPLDNFTKSANHSDQNSGQHQGKSNKKKGKVDA